MPKNWWMAPADIFQNSTIPSWVPPLNDCLLAREKMKVVGRGGNTKNSVRGQAKGSTESAELTEGGRKRDKLEQQPHPCQQNTCLLLEAPQSKQSPRHRKKAELLRLLLAEKTWKNWGGPWDWMADAPTERNFLIEVICRVYIHVTPWSFPNRGCRVK